MLIIMVDVSVNAVNISDFLSATRANIDASRLEPGISRFDLLQDSAVPGQFFLLEIYHNEQAQQAHKETPHYQAWRDMVAPMMAKPRSSRKLQDLFPADPGWASGPRQ